VSALREALARRLPGAREVLADRNLNVAVNGEMVISGESAAPIANGDRVQIVHMIAGG
jgi:sulfur carrier protein ThiS